VKSDLKDPHKHYFTKQMIIASPVSSPTFSHLSEGRLLNPPVIGNRNFSRFASKAMCSPTFLNVPDKSSLFISDCLLKKIFSSQPGLALKATRIFVKNEHKVVLTLNSV
jgi:hypothetical protein